MDEPALNARDRVIDLLLKLGEDETTTAKLAAAELKLVITTLDGTLRGLYKDGLLDRPQKTETGAFQYCVKDEEARQALVAETVQRQTQRRLDWIIGNNATREARERDKRFCNAVLELIERDGPITMRTVTAITGDSRGTTDTRLDRYRRLGWLAYAPQEDVNPSNGAPPLYAMTETGREKFPELLDMLKRDQPG